MDTIDTTIISGTRRSISKRAIDALERYRRAIQDVFDDRKCNALTHGEALARIDALSRAYSEEQEVIYHDAGI